MRGKVVAHCGCIFDVGITPAYAGKSSRERQERQRRRDHPRVCGEKHVIQLNRTWFLGSPPRMRGKVRSSLIVAALTGITPAYAGKRVLFATLIAPKKDHPRVCGEKPSFFGIFYPGVRITPAYAGKRAPALFCRRW